MSEFSQGSPSGQVPGEPAPRDHLQEALHERLRTDLREQLHDDDLQGERPDDLEGDVVVLGLGSGGEVAAGELAAAGLEVVAVEAAQDGDAGASAKGLLDAGVRLLRGRGRLTSRRTLLVERDAAPTLRVRWRRALVIGTGSEPIRPPIDDLACTPVWTSDEARSSPERPARLVVVGGGAVGCELAQAYAASGSEVTLVEAGPSLLPGEDAWVGAAVTTALTRSGVDVRTGVTVTSVQRDLPPADRVLLATGRSPRTSGLGLELLGVHATGEERSDAPLPVDARCRVIGADGDVLDDVFAVGDVTGVAPFTNAASYQGRIVAAHLLGRGRDADYRGLPRAVHTRPAVFSVGLTRAAARRQGLAVVSADADPGGSGRGPLEPGGEFGLTLVADARTGVLLGATAVAPDADSWAGELALAVRAGIGVDVLADLVHAVPTWGEAIHPPARELAETVAENR